MFVRPTFFIIDLIARKGCDKGYTIDSLSQLCKPSPTNFHNKKGGADKHTAARVYGPQGLYDVWRATPYVVGQMRDPVAY